jgi:hypothetical protein
MTVAGSQCYGLSNELSDLDMKGICVPPRNVENDLFHRFEQADNYEPFHTKFDHLKNPKNPKIESTVYSLKKFMILAANVNPNIVELLWVDLSDILTCMPVAEKLLANRDLFLSSKAKYTFSGYAMAQAAKIERHRKWIVMGELTPPSREQFGLGPEVTKGVSEVFGYIKSKVEEWNLNQFPIDEQQRADLKETIWTLIEELSGKKVTWDNWPDAYAAGVIEKVRKDLSLKDEVIYLINQERAYDKAMSNYKSWIRWKAERNPARRELEVKSGYDTKHASHLVRLMRMGYEILTEGKVIVKRPDREEILSVKNGGWSYEKVMEFAKEMQAKLDVAYKATTLRKSVDFEKVNKLYHELYEDYHRNPHLNFLYGY